MPDGLRIHDLRHTAASLLVSAGANVKVVQRHLGHSTATQTLDRYAHLFTEDLEAVAEHLDKVSAAGNERHSRSTSEARVVELDPVIARHSHLERTFYPRQLTKTPGLVVRGA